MCIRDRLYGAFDARCVAGSGGRAADGSVAGARGAVGSVSGTRSSSRELSLIHI